MDKEKKEERRKETLGGKDEEITWKGVNGPEKVKEREEN